MSAQTNPDRHKPTLTNKNRNRQTNRYVRVGTDKPRQTQPTLTVEDGNVGGS